MTSLVDERLGVQVPQIVHQPPDVVSLAAAEEAIELADAYGVAGGFGLDESQRFTLRVALGERADGSWAAATVGDFEPRQNGKNDTCNARELAGLILFGEKLLIHTAHEFKTAQEAFLRMVAVFEAWDDLRRQVRIRFANGEQAITIIKTGQRLMYQARTGGSGRGFAKADLVAYDEAQHLRGEHLAASGPAKLANRNAQSWYMGSGGMETSEFAWRMRRRALAGNGGRFGYVEHTAENVRFEGERLVSSAPDVLDREAWALANAAYGRRITDESLFSLYEEMGPELFARECLCIWDPEVGTVAGLIDAETWRARRTADHQPGSLRYALDVSPEGRFASVACSDGRLLEVVKYGEGTGWVVPSCVKHRKAMGGEVVLDPAGPAGELVAELEAVRFKVRQVTPREAVQGCGQLLTAIKDGKVAHLGQVELDRAVANADQRDIGDGGWLWSRLRSSVDISPLVAVTLARWAAVSTRRPKPKIHVPEGVS